MTNATAWLPAQIESLIMAPITVLGIPATFMEEDLAGLISDPFGASLSLILFGLFFARKLYRINLLTIADYYRERYDNRVELITGIAIAVSQHQCFIGAEFLHQVKSRWRGGIGLRGCGSFTEGRGKRCALLSGLYKLNPSGQAQRCIDFILEGEKPSEPTYRIGFGTPNRTFFPEGQRLAEGTKEAFHPTLPACAEMLQILVAL